jgi:transposase InsO family protein
LLKYLSWYNQKRPHHTLGLVSPQSFINNLKMEA